jgi:prephenate dehydrogenase (NADP+)
MSFELEIGLIGMGDMGRLYAQAFLSQGYTRINVCDRPEIYPSLQQELLNSGLQVLHNGYAVARRSDFIIYSVEAASIDAVVSLYGQGVCMIASHCIATKVGAIVCGQVCVLLIISKCKTSVKEPEIRAFSHLFS